MHHVNETLVRKLLIVDDSKVSRMRIHAFFQSACPHWTIVEAVSGDQALVMAADDPPDFVTMDVNMPGMSGYETAQMMLMRNASIRVVIVTGNIKESSRQVAASLRLNFVAKPVSEASMQQALDYMVASE